MPLDSSKTLTMGNDLTYAGKDGDVRGSQAVLNSACREVTSGLPHAVSLGVDLI